MSDEEIDAYPPWNFSWVVPNQLAGMAFPRNKENLRFLVNEGIKHLVTLSPEKKPPIMEMPQLEWTEIAVDEFEAPTVKDIRRFIDICQRCQLRNEPVGVHCRQGRGRTGVMLACYLMVFQNMPPERAVMTIRALRPNSCETEEQVEVVGKYYDSMKGKTTINYDEVDNKEVFDARFKKDEDEEKVSTDNVMDV